MKKEVVITFKVKEIGLRLIEEICQTGYNVTGKKFWFNFNGSKGYLDNIEICCSSHTHRISYNRMARERKIKILFSQEDGFDVKSEE